MVLVLDGRALLDGLDWSTRFGLAGLTVGAVACLAHGAAVAQSALLRWVARPPVAWPLVLAGAVLLYLS